MTISSGKRPTAQDAHCESTIESTTRLTMDIRSILSTTPPRQSHPSASSSGSSASNSQPINGTTSATTPSINSHSTTAITERPVPDLDTTARRTLPHDGFDDMYDDSRHNSPEANAGPGRGLSDLPPNQESNVRSEPLTSSINSQLVETNPAAPTPGASVPRTTGSTFPGAWSPVLSLRERNSPPDHQPIDRTTSAPSSGINVHETRTNNSRDEPQDLTPGPRTTLPVGSSRLETAARSSNRIPNNTIDAWTARPNAVARNFNRIPDGAEIHDVDAWEAQRHTQLTRQPSDLSSQASSCTLSGCEQTAVGNLASDSPNRNIPQRRSGPTSGSSAKYENGSPNSGPGLERWLYTDIDTALQDKIDEQLGAALLCRYANDCHKQDEIRQGKKKITDAPISRLFPSIENESTAETETSDGNEANMDYIYNVRPHTLTSNGTGVKTLKANPGNAVWSLVKTRLGIVNDSRTWETACKRCFRRGHLCPSCTEERERTISPEVAAVDDNRRHQTEGAALALASGQATSSRSRNTITRYANGNVNSNANGTQTHTSPPSLPSSHPSRRTRRPTTPEPEVSPRAPPPAASSSRRSQRRGILGRSRARNPDQDQALDRDSDDEDDEQGRRGGDKKKKSASSDSKEDGQANKKRKACEPVEDVDRDRPRVARARRQQTPESSNGSNESGPSQQTQTVTATATAATGPGIVPNGFILSAVTGLPVRDMAGGYTSDRATYANSPATLRPSPLPPALRPVPRRTLTLRVVPEANPGHPDHRAYLLRRVVGRSIEREIIENRIQRERIERERVERERIERERIERESTERERE